MQAPLPDASPSRRQVLRAGCVLVAAAGCGGPSEGPSEAAPVVEAALGAVVMSITPGKPGAPTETIRAELDGVGGTLVVRRAAWRADPDEVRVQVSRAELEALWTLVEEEGLSALRARPVDSPTPDFGQRVLRIERAGSPPHEVSWTRPLENEAAVAVLIAALGALAQRHAPDLPLHYFPGP